MKYILLVLLIGCSNPITPVNEFCGRYNFQNMTVCEYNYIELFDNYTFHHRYKTDTMAINNDGKWSFSNDTIYLAYKDGIVKGYQYTDTTIFIDTYWVYNKE